jgi:putative aldouronate transport system substrate-binding protein
MKKKLLCAILSLAMLSAIAGCAKANELTAETTPPPSEQAAAPAETQPDESLPSWQTDTTPVTLDWYVAFDTYNKVFNPEVNLGDKALLENTGISLNIIVGNLEKLNLLIETDDLPDLVTFPVTAPQRTLLENGGRVWSLDELSAQYAPDLNVQPSLKDWYRNGDGQWYTYVSHFYGLETEERGGFFSVQNYQRVRQDILDQIGMTKDQMQTKEGFLNALRAVKEQNIQFDGKPVRPLLGIFPEQLVQQFGGAPEDKDGNLVYIKRAPEYLEALQYYNTMYREGLITDEAFTLSYAQEMEAFSAGEVFAGTHHSTTSGPRRTLSSYDPNAKYVYCGAILGGDISKTAYVTAVSTAGWSATVIPKKSKNPDRAVQFISYMTSVEATLNTYAMGYEGWDLVDGKIVARPEVVQEFADNNEAANAKHNMNIGYFVDYTVMQAHSAFDPGSAWYTQDDWWIQHEPYTLPLPVVYDDKCITSTIPEAGTQEAIIKGAIDDYWIQSLPKIIMASSQEECTKIYNDTIAEMERMGLKDLEAYQNERFQENKAKLGIKFVWPGNL